MVALSHCFFLTSVAHVQLSDSDPVHHCTPAQDPQYGRTDYGMKNLLYLFRNMHDVVQKDGRTPHVRERRAAHLLGASSRSEPTPRRAVRGLIAADIRKA